MKNYLIVTCFILLSSSTSFSQNFVLPLWENNIPNNNDVFVTEKADTSDIIRIQEVDNPIIQVYLPSNKVNAGEAVIICPGGGYKILAFDWEGTDVAKWLNSNGICAIVLKYRLPQSESNIDGRLSPFLDVQRALRLTRYNAKSWRINPNKIGVMGFSAGGHLASTLGTHFDEDFFSSDKIDSISCRPDFMILMYPVITFGEPNLHTGSRQNLIGDKPDPFLINYYSNELHITKNTPPTFLVHADDDKAVPVENSLMFYQKLKENNIPSEMHIFKEGGHGFGLAIGKGRLGQWKDLCLTWIRTVKEEK